MTRKRGPCLHCWKVCSLFPRDLCNDHYRDRAIRGLYPVKRPYRGWTAREARDLRDYLKGGMTTKAAAALLGRSAKSVQAMRHREGLGKFKKYCPERDKKVARLLYRGLGVVEAARRSGLCSHTAARRLAKRLGLQVENQRAKTQARLRKNEFVADGIYRFHAGRERDRVATALAGWPSGCTSAQALLMKAVIDGNNSFPKIGRAIRKSTNCAQQMAYKLVRLGWLLKDRKPGRRPTIHINWDHDDWDDRPIRLKHGPREEMRACAALEGKPS